MKIDTTKLILTALITISFSWLQAAELQSSGNSTDWHDANAWTLISGTESDTIPDADDIVTIADGDTIIIGASASCLSLFVTSTGGNTVLTTNSGTVLTIGDEWQHLGNAASARVEVTVNGTVDVAGRYYINSSNADFDCDITISSLGRINANYGLVNTMDITNSTGSVFACAGVFDVASSMEFIMQGSSQMTVNLTGTMDVGKSLELNTQGVSGGIDFNLDGGTLDIDQHLTLMANGGASADSLIVNMEYVGARLEIYDSVKLDSSGGKILANGLNSTVSFNGSDQSILVDTNVFYYNLELAGSGTKTLQGDLSSTNIFGNVTVNTGVTFNTDGNQLDVPVDLTINGSMNTSDTININSDLTIGFGGTLTSTAAMNMNLAGDWLNLGTYTYATGDNVVLNGSSQQTIGGNTTWYELTLSNSGGAAVVNGTQNIEGILDIDEGTFSANGYPVVLVSDASGTAQMDNVGTGSYVGDLEVERYVDCSKNGWREISSPVDSTTLEDWQNNGITFSGFTGSSYPSFGWINAYCYNDTLANGVDEDGWVEAADIADTTGPSQGWRVYLGSSTHRLDVTGTPYQGDFAMNLKYEDDAGAADEEGWNLIGNPFPCTIDWDAIDAGNKVNLDDAYWVWITEGVVTPQYGLYVGGDIIGTHGTTQYMPHSHSFWVHATADDPSITIREADKNTTDQDFYKSGATAANDLIKISAYNSADLLCDEVILKLRDDADNNYVAGEDFPKRWTATSFVEETTSLMFVLGGKEVSYNTISSTTQDVYLKSYIGANFTGDVTLKFDNLENYKGNACVVLEDLHTGSTQDLRVLSEYTYTKNFTEPDVRFVIHITEEVASVNPVSPTCSGDTDGVIEIEGISASSYTLEWKDANGTVIGTGSDTQPSFDVTGLEAGQYTISFNVGCELTEMNVEVLPTTAVSTEIVLSNPTIDIALGESPIVDCYTKEYCNLTWDMGDGNVYNTESPAHDYANAGNYTISVEAVNDRGCVGNNSVSIEVINSSPTSIEENDLTSNASVYTSGSEIVIETSFEEQMDASITVLTIEGKIIAQEKALLGYNELRMPKKGASGIYLVNIQLDNGENLTYKIQ
jgi:hypothetical protein